MPELLEDYKKSGLKIRVWTVNRKEDMKKFIENDLEAVITTLDRVFGSQKAGGRCPEIKD